MSVRHSVGGIAAAVALAVIADGCADTEVVTVDAAERMTTTTVAVSTPAPPPALAKARPRSRQRWKACDANIKAKSGMTTCAFAQNVFYGYWKATVEGDDAFVAYSPAAASEFVIDCSGGDTVVCRTSDGSAIKFPQSAVDLYTFEAAEAYCQSHELGAAGDDCAAPAEATSENPPGEYLEESSEAPLPEDDCHTSYVGVCLDPDAYDYDCASGSGDGPEYTGMVEVVGDDPYDLDRDGDGLGCE